MYTLTLTQDELETLLWLRDHGYDAGLYGRLEGGAEEGEYRLPEVDAWEWLEDIRQNPHAYLTCCGDDALANKLARLEDSVV